MSREKFIAQLVIGTDKEGKFQPIVATSEQVEIDISNILKNTQNPMEDLCANALGHLILNTKTEELKKRCAEHDDLSQNDVLLKIREHLMSTKTCVQRISKINGDEKGEKVLIINYNE